MARAARNTRNTNERIIESGVTHHISPNLMDFHEYHPLEESLQVESADSVSLATAAGSINLQLDCGIFLRVEALYVPRFGASLLSVPQLIKNGIDVSFRSHSRSAYITSEDFTEQPLGRCAPVSMSFVLLGNVPSKRSHANTAVHRVNAQPRSNSDSVPRSNSDSVPRSNSDSVPRSNSNLAPQVNSDLGFRTDIQTWHRHFNHLNLSDVRKLLPKGSYSEKETATSTACDICIKATAKEKFQRKVPAWRATKPLELIHSDLCGPISPQSLSGRRYYILYIDDFSRYTWVCFLHSKSSSEVCTVFRDFKNLVKLQQKHRITRFWCDNGKAEYDNKAFRSILTEYGITF